MIIIFIINFVIDTLAIALHSLGLFLLRNVKASHTFPEIQRYLLIQLSSYELVCGLLFLLYDCIAVVIYYDGGKNNSSLTEMKLVLKTIIFLPSIILFFILMLAITVDRFLHVYLNIRYRLVCKLKTFKIMLMVCQLSMVVFTLLIVIFREHTPSFFAVAIVYIWPIGDGLFLIVAIGTYSYFFVKIKENQKAIFQISNRVNQGGKNELQSNLETQSSHGTLRKNSLMKSFFMLGILILSFILFVVIPDEVAFWHHILNIEITEEFEQIMITVFKHGYLSDAIIYIFLQKEVLRRAKIFVLRCR